MLVVDDHLALLAIAGQLPSLEGVDGPVATTWGFHFRLTRALADSARSGTLSRRLSDPAAALRRALRPPAHRLVVLDPRASTEEAVRAGGARRQSASRRTRWRCGPFRRSRPGVDREQRKGVATRYGSGRNRLRYGRGLMEDMSHEEQHAFFERLENQAPQGPATRRRGTNAGRGADVKRMLRDGGVDADWSEDLKATRNAVEQPPDA